MLVPEAHEKFYLNATQLRAPRVAPGGLRGACGRLEADGPRPWHNAPGWAGAGRQVRRRGWANLRGLAGLRAPGRAGCVRPSGRGRRTGLGVGSLSPGTALLRSSHLLGSLSFLPASFLSLFVRGAPSFFFSRPFQGPAFS